MVVAQQRHHVFRIGALGEPGEPAQIAEERGYLSAMAFQLLLAPRRNNQIGHLRRQEAPQPAHAFYFAHLVGDGLFELLVQLFDFLSSPAQFLEQPCILDGDHCLVSKGGDQLLSASQ